MNVSDLQPAPVKSEAFRRNRERFIPQTAGCYVLATFSHVVLYVGLTNNLRRRMNEHLDSGNKTLPTSKGRAIFFFWKEGNDIHKIERTWMNIHIQHEGVLPELNKVFSPTTV